MEMCAHERYQTNILSMEKSYTHKLRRGEVVEISQFSWKVFLRFYFFVAKTSDPSLNLSEKRPPCTLFTHPLKNEPLLRYKFAIKFESKSTYIMPLLKGSNM